MSATPEIAAGERRFWVKLTKRGKKTMLTLNGGVLFKDPELAMQGVWAAMKRDGWTRAVVTEAELEEVREVSDGVSRYWKVIGTATFTPDKAKKP